MIFIQVKVAEWLPFGKALLIRFTVYSKKKIFFLLFLFVALVVSHYGFEDRTLVMIASVPGHCLTDMIYSLEK